MDLPRIFWPAERLIQEHIARLEELEGWYSLDDIYDRNDALDARLEVEKRFRKNREPEK